MQILITTITMTRVAIGALPSPIVSILVRPEKKNPNQLAGGVLESPRNKAKGEWGVC